MTACGGAEAPTARPGGRPRSCRTAPASARASSTTTCSPASMTPRCAPPGLRAGTLPHRRLRQGRLLHHARRHPAGQAGRGHSGAAGPQPAPGLRFIGLIYLAIGIYVLFRRWTAPRATHFYLFCLVSFALNALKYTGAAGTGSTRPFSGAMSCRVAAAGAVSALRPQLP